MSRSPGARERRARFHKRAMCHGVKKSERRLRGPIVRFCLLCKLTSNFKIIKKNSQKNQCNDSLYVNNGSKEARSLWSTGKELSVEKRVIMHAVCLVLLGAQTCPYETYTCTLRSGTQSSLLSGRQQKGSWKSNGLNASFDSQETEGSLPRWLEACQGAEPGSVTHQATFPSRQLPR